MIHVQNNSQFDECPTETQLQTWVSAVLKAEETNGELTIRFADKAEIQALNNDYRNKDKPTNVLSFPFEAPEEFEEHYLGDIIICPAIIETEAHQQEKSLEDHYAHMIVHGTLHLLGYDHIEDDEAAVMEAKEVNILAQLKIADPYGDSDD